MKNIKLRDGEILTITSPTLNDAQELVDYANTIRFESKFITMGGRDELSTLASQEKWIQANLDNNRRFIFVAKINGKIVGLGNFGSKSNKIRLAHRCEIGISVLKAFWGLGIATEIMKVMIKKAKEVGFEQIELQVVEENAPARHIYTKLGFYETGYIKNGMKFADGSYAKLILMQKDLV
jgi:RimJ/RimL family protein N-acetyltransferase